MNANLLNVSVQTTMTQAVKTRSEAIVMREILSGIGSKSDELD
jgi:hypothetical protein